MQEPHPTCIADPLPDPAQPHVLSEDPPLLPAAPSVSTLLSESRAHNLTRLRYANAKAYPAAEAEAASALAKRLQAHDLDPEHVDPSWALDKAPHADIVAFLRGYGDIP